MAIDYSAFQIEEAPDYSNLVKVNNLGSDPGEESDPVTGTDENEVDENDDHDTPSVDPMIYKSVLQAFADKEGEVVPEDLDIKSALEFEEKLEEMVISKRLKKKEEERYANAHPEVKLFLGIREYFDDETQAIAFARTKSALEGFTEDDLENEDLQKTIYLDYLTSIKNMTKEEAEEEIEEAETLGKLSDKASAAKDKIIGHLNAQIDGFKTNKKTKEEKETKDFHSRFENILDTFKSIETAGELKVTDELKKKMKENFTKVVHVEGGKSFNDFSLKQHKHKDEITLAIEYFNTLGLFNVDKAGKWTPDFSKLSKLSAKNVKSKLDEAILESQRTGGVGATQTLGNRDKLRDLGYNV